MPAGTRSRQRSLWKPNAGVRVHQLRSASAEEPFVDGGWVITHFTDEVALPVERLKDGASAEDWHRTYRGRYLEEIEDGDGILPQRSLLMRKQQFSDRPWHRGAGLKLAFAFARESGSMPLDQLIKRWRDASAMRSATAEHLAELLRP